MCDTYEQALARQLKEREDFFRHPFLTVRKDGENWVVDTNLQSHEQIQEYIASAARYAVPVDLTQPVGWVDRSTGELPA